MRDLDSSASALAHFGSELRHYRLAAGCSQEQVGRACLASTSLAGAIENARRMPSRDFAERADEFLGTGGALARLLRLVGREGHPRYFREFAELEREASVLRQFEPLAVPGLLQTEDYARAILRTTSPDATAEQIEELVTARMERQAILDRPVPPTLVVLLDEGVLSRTVGGREVMRAQLDALVEAAQRPKVVIQVVPTSAGASAGLAGMFIIATLNDNGGDVVYFETVATGQVIDRADDVAACAAAFEVLRAEALPREASLDLIRKRKEEFEL